MNAIFEALCRASIFGLVALAVALLAQWLLNKRVPASWRAWIWRIALLQSAFALLPIAPIRWEILAPPNVASIAATSPDTTEPDEFFVPENLPPPSMPDAAPIESAPPIPVDKAQSALSVSIAETPLDWRALMLAIYALGIIFQFKQLARGYRQLQRTLRACTPSGNSITMARLNTLATRLQLKSAPQILISEGKSPFLTGVWRPQIVLPRALCDVETAQLDAVLAHELAHQKRRDLIWLGATWLLQTLLWFHPLSWVSRRFHGLETECACDELALRLAPIAPQSYGALLLNSMNNSKFSSPLAAGTCDTLFALKTRLLRLNSAPVTPRKTAKLAFVAALLLSCSAVVPLKLVARAGDSPIVAPTDKMQAPPKSQLAGSAVVQGVVTSKQTGKPLAGVKMILSPRVKGLAPKENTQRFQETWTDARGYFRFNAIAGYYVLLTWDWGSKTISGNGRIGGQNVEYFTIKDGQKQEFNFQVDETLKESARKKTPNKLPKTRVMGSAVVQGVVTSKQTGKSLAGVRMILMGSQPNSNPAKFSPDLTAKQEVLTDARGYFRFNATSGKHFLAVAVTTSPKTMAFSAQRGAFLDLKSGKKYDFKFDIDDKSKRDPNRIPTKLPATRGTGDAVVQGVIVSKQTQKPLAGVTILVMDRDARRTPKQKGLAKTSASQETVTDARGYFRFNVAGGVHSLFINSKIWDAPGKTTVVDPRRMTVLVAKQVHVVTLGKTEMRNLRFELNETRATADKAATAPVAATNAESVSGQIVDENGRVLANVDVQILQVVDGMAQDVGTTKSDKNGRYRLNGLRAGAEILVGAELSGYGLATSDITKKGLNTNYEMTMPRASATLRGVVLGEDGRPASNFRVEPFGAMPNARTDAQGRFVLKQIVPGAAQVRVFTPNGSNGWGPINVRGGDQNATIRLKKSISDARFPRPVLKTMSYKTRALIGKTAPEILAVRWVNDKSTSLQALRGQVVLLVFDDFVGENQQVWNVLARQNVGKLQIVGVQVNSIKLPMTDASFNKIAAKSAFPIALDAGRGDGNGLGGQTFSDYGLGITGKHGYAVVGRDGKIIRAGDDLIKAIKFANR